ncbi:MAG: endonuclease/exonuclease/phosphatase family protein, partial [Nannocystaceae bacterium]
MSTTRPRPRKRHGDDRYSQVPTLRVLTLNVHGWTDAHAQPNGSRVAELLHDQAPDLVAFQEVSSLPVIEKGRPRRSTLAWLADVCGYNHSGADRRGCALLSRFPITAVEDITSSAKGARRKRSNGHFESRLLACAVETPKGPLRLMVLHLNHAHAERRMHQIE